MNNLNELFAIADRETKAGHNKAAIQAYQQILQQSEAGSQAQHLAYWGIGDLYAKNKKWSEAQLCIEEAEKQDPDSPLIRKLKKDVAFFRSEFERLSGKLTA